MFSGHCYYFLAPYSYLHLHSFKNQPDSFPPNPLSIPVFGLFCGPGPDASAFLWNVLSSSASVTPFLPRGTTPGSDLRPYNQGDLQKGETMRWAMPGKWKVMNTAAGGADCWSQVIRLPSGRPQNTGSSFPFLTLLARLPSILGRYSADIPPDPELGTSLTIPGNLAGLNASSQGLLVNHGSAL